MKTDRVLTKARLDILKLKNENNKNNETLIQYIIEVVKNRCGVLLANQLVKELALNEQFKAQTSSDVLN